MNLAFLIYRFLIDIFIWFERNAHCLLYYFFFLDILFVLAVNSLMALPLLWLPFIWFCYSIHQSVVHRPFLFMHSLRRLVVYLYIVCQTKLSNSLLKTRAKIVFLPWTTIRARWSKESRIQSVHFFFFFFFLKNHTQTGTHT